MDRLKLFGAATISIVAFMGALAFADAHRIDFVWVSLGAMSLVFFAGIGWDYRSQFRSPLFILFFGMWLMIHLLVFAFVLTRLGWGYWILALLVELFLFYATAYWLFGLRPPSPHNDV